MGKRAILEAKASALPLEQFPAHMQAEIRLAVECAQKPPQWLNFGSPGGPAPIGGYPEQSLV